MVLQLRENLAENSCKILRDNLQKVEPTPWVKCRWKWGPYLVGVGIIQVN
jgi:hypothetical protein